VNDLDIDLARNTPWVDMSACVKFRLDRPSRLAGHREQTDKHIRFYYIDNTLGEKYANFNVFCDVNEFYVFRQELVHSRNKLSAENGRNINSNIYVKL